MIHGNIANIPIFCDNCFQIVWNLDVSLTLDRVCVWAGGWISSSLDYSLRPCTHYTKTYYNILIESYIEQFFFCSIIVIIEMLVTNIFYIKCM